MSTWALWDRAVPIIAALTAYTAGYRLGRHSERIDWLTRPRDDPSRSSQ